MGVLLQAVWLVLGLGVLIVLLYVPGAVALNALGQRHPAPQLFSGTEEWIFTAVVISFLVTGGAGFVLAELGLFTWWSVLVIVLLPAVGVAAAWRTPLRAGPIVSLLKPPPGYAQRVTDRRVARVQR